MLSMAVKNIILGVGNRVRGDDAVGSLVIEELKGIDGLTAIDCGTTPENYIEPVVALKPERILLVDACSYGGKPGEFRQFEREDIDRLSAGFLSTHTLPLTMTITMLEQQVKAKIQLLGVQPATIQFGEGLTAPVAAALPRLVSFIKDWAHSV
jgi:hydrogenase 3 maturation protease